MIRLKGYYLDKLHYEDERILVYKASRKEDHLPVYIKIYKEAYPKNEELELIENEYHILKNLDLSGIIKVHDMKKIGYQTCIIFERFDGVSLKKYMHDNILSIQENLQIIIRITEIIEQLHEQNIIYNAINPNNIFINPETKKIKFYFFKLARKIDNMQENMNFEKWNKEYIYTSPEQTGRITHEIDFRSDLYMLGIISYEMLTGILPFETEDVSGSIHSHIAKEPIPPNEINSEIPQVISDIVMKLLEKVPEERYQSAYGLKTDIDKCYQQLKSQGKVVWFKLGKHDGNENFELSKKLYGREEELEKLLNEFKGVCAGKCSMLFYSGTPGMGKTYLINQFRKQISKYNIYFISGKFDKYDQNIPYSAIIQVFQELVKQILTESSEKLYQWKRILSKALDTNGEIIVDLIPELEYIIGKQQNPLSSEAINAKIRFNYIFKALVKAITYQPQPIVIFIDDWQWADTASLNWLEEVIMTSDCRYLMFIGAYRSNEITPVHLLLKNKNIMTLNLEHLEFDAVNRLVGDTMKCSLEECKSLSEFVFQKSHGNPLFIVQYLKALYYEKMLKFDDNTLTWQWDWDRVMAEGVNDDLLHLMIERLEHLPQHTQRLLCLASCIGNKFSLNMLSMISEESQAEIFQHLCIAMQTGVIIPIIIEENSSLFINNFRFLHDKIQQAAYQSINEIQKKTIHLEIGRILLNTVIDKEELEDKIFDIVNQCNKAIESITDETERGALAELNFIAGKKAKITIAYESALKFLTISTNLVDDEKWKLNYQFMFDLYKERAEVEYLNGNFEQSQRFLGILLKHVKSKLQKAEIYGLMIVHYSMRSKYDDEAIEIASKALRIFDIEVSVNNIEKLVEEELAGIKKFLEDTDVESLLHKSDMMHKENKVLIKLLDQILLIFYFWDIQVWRFLVMKAVNISLQLGHAPESAFLYAMYARYLAVTGDYQNSCTFGKLAFKISQKYNNTSQKCRVYGTLACDLIHWFKHINNSYNICREGYQLGLEAGELQFAGYIGISHYLMNTFAGGEKLQDIACKIPEYYKFSKETKNNLIINLLRCFAQIITGLIGEDNMIHSLKDIVWNKDEYLKQYKKDKSYISMVSYQILKGQELYLLEKPNEALSYIQEAEKYLEYVKPTIIYTEHNFYYSLCLTALYNEASQSDREKYLKQLHKNQDQLKIWADQCQENFMHKYMLIEAEKANILDQPSDAMDLFDSAVDTAKKYHYIQHEALANELAAKFYIKRGRHKVATVYMKEAKYLYNLWGAKQKCEVLNKKYEYMIPLREKEKEYNDLHLVDMHAIMKTSQTISREIVLESLIDKLVQTAVKAAGATRGILMRKTDEVFYIVGEMHYKHNRVKQHISVEESGDIPKSIINYALRTKDNIIIDNVMKNELFITDQYFKENKVKSIICMPIIYRGNVKMVAYMENNLTYGAFTKTHLQTLNLLFSQAAISIENAQMYELLKEMNRNLEKEVEKRTKELMESKRRYKQLMQVLPDAVYVFDREKILFANQAATKLVGYNEKKDVVGKTLSSFISVIPRNEDITIELINKLWEICSLTSFEYTLLRKVDGETIDIEITTTFINYNGTEAILAVIRDISERKRVESLRIEAEQNEKKLEEALKYDRLKTEFFSNISHELKTPLNIIFSAMQLLDISIMKDDKDANLQRCSKHLKMIKQNAYRLLRLVNNLIDITRIDSGFTKLNLQNTNIVEVVENITLSTVEYIKSKSRTIVFDTDIEEKIMAFDPDKMERIILNLISNAIKFTRPKDNIEVRLYNKGERVIISVKDTGIGIPDDKQKIIFERFRQAQNLFNRNHEGSGIGLSLVKSLVELHGGTIDVKSKYGEGTEFSIKIPVKLVEEDSCITQTKKLIQTPNVEKIKIEFSDIYE